MAEIADRVTLRQRSSRRWLRFGLRTMLLAVTVICIKLAIDVNAARRQKNVVDRIDRHGYAKVYYDHQRPNGYFSPGAGSEPFWLSRYLGVDYFHTVVGVYFSQFSRVPKKASGLMNELGQLPNLRFLSVCNGWIQSDDLRHIERSTELRELALTSNQIDDAGLCYTANLTRLEYLELGGNPLTNKAIERLSALPNLRTLGLAGTSVSDGCILELAELPNLEHVDIRKTQISSDGVRVLKQLKPKLSIRFSDD